MPFFSIGFPERERVEVSLLGGAADPASEGFDWVRARVRVEVGGLSGDVEIYMCLSDMVRFKEQLEPVYRNLRGAAEFTTIEGQLFIRVEVNHLGHARATGHLIDDVTTSNRLSFDIEFDQTMLGRTISEIDRALAELSPKQV
jgi:hypothetical protein